MTELDFGKVLNQVPDETKAAVLEFIKNWFPLIAQLAYADMCSLAQRLNEKDYRGNYYYSMCFHNWHTGMV